MSAHSKDRVTSVFRRLFKPADKAVVSPENVGAEKPDSSAEPKNARPVIIGGGHDSPSKRRRSSTNSVAPTKSKLPQQALRTRRLMKEYKEIRKLQESVENPTFKIELINDNLHEWFARLYVIDPDSHLAKDMKELNIPCIVLHLIFPDNFPFAPPFMRVVEPRIEKGYVMDGGAICMELLTPRGWASAYTVEAIIMQFAASVVKGQGRVMRKGKHSKDFSRRIAEESFRSLVKTHEKYGWVTPALADG